MKKNPITALLLFMCLLTTNAFAQSQFKTLENKIKKIAASDKMDIGVGCLHIESGQSFYINENKPYPLASVYKVPIMICLLQKVDENKLSLSDKITLYEHDKCIGGGYLQYEKAGSQFTVSHLMNKMITVSDNTAADLLWNLIGDKACNKLIASINLNNSNIYIVERPNFLLSLAQGSEFKGKTGKQIAAAWKNKNITDKEKSIKNVLAETKNLTLYDLQKIENQSEITSTYENDVICAEALDNVSSPYDFTQILLNLYNGKFLSQKSTALALSVMADCKFKNRLPAKLPKNVKVMHKTGTICGIVNDAGIIEISPTSHVIVTVFVRNIKNGYQGDAVQKIAEISKVIYDHAKLIK